MLSTDAGLVVWEMDASSITCFAAKFLWCSTAAVIVLTIVVHLLSYSQR